MDIIDLTQTPEWQPKETLEEDLFNPLHVLTCHHHQELDILKKRGIIRKIGKWDTSEINQLKQNMQHYLEANSVNDFSRLIYPQTKEERDFRKRTLFTLKMCEGIHRTRDVIRAKVECYFPTFLRQGNFSAQEKEEILKLYKVYGSQRKKWKKIATVMGRNHYGMGNIYAELVSNHGPWTKEEDEALIKAVDVFKKKGEKILWKVVSRRVGTRGGAWCRDRWYRKFRNVDRNTSTETVDFDDEDSFKMITVISESNIDDHYLIDWEELSRHFSNSVSPTFLKWKFGALTKEIPNSQFLDFEEIIEELLEKYSRKVARKECHGDASDTSVDCSRDIVINNNSSNNGDHIMNAILIAD